MPPTATVGYSARLNKPGAAHGVDSGNYHGQPVRLADDERGGRDPGRSGHRLRKPSIVSAHRTPDRLWAYGKTAVERGLKVIIAGAGGAAHLPGMMASKTRLPVIGVPVQTKALSGVDSLYSIVQMPKGYPVATMAIGARGRGQCRPDGGRHPRAVRPRPGPAAGRLARRPVRLDPRGAAG